MSTTIKRIQFGSSAWVMRPDPPRAVMTIVVTVAGFDAHDLIPDLAHHLAESLAWGELYITIVPVDMVPLDTVDMGRVRGARRRARGGGRCQPAGAGLW